MISSNGDSLIEEESDYSQTASSTPPLVSIVMPCLNEADTLGICIEKAIRGLIQAGVPGEVIIADNGSIDRSREIAQKLGARVVPVEARGYGSALMGGIEAARGRYVIMGDADDSYDFLEVPKFVEQLQAGHELVQGCRARSGGGRVLPGAMPFLHRWFGNPALTHLVRFMFRTQIRDVYCGMRGFSKDLYTRLDQRCTGMEFAAEMIIKSSLTGASTTEVPITLHPDGRKAHAPHLKTFRDGWRTLRLFMLMSPRWLFLAPGSALIFLALLGYAVVLPGIQIAGITPDASSLLVASLAALVGEQAILLSVFAKTFAIDEGVLPPDPRMERFFKVFTLEKGLILSVLAIIAGLSLLAFATNRWRIAGFGPLDYASTLRLAIPGVTLTALGFQTAFGSFFVSLLGIRRR